MGVLSGDGQCVESLEISACALGEVAGSGDFGVAHAITDEKDYVLCVLLRGELIVNDKNNFLC